MESSLILAGLRNAAGAALYVALVVTVMQAIGRSASQAEAWLQISAFLMLFVLSALVEALFVLGQPVWMFLHGQRAEALKLLGYTVGALIVATGLAILVAFM